MKIHLATDHAGLDLKNSIKNNQIENILKNYEKLIDLLTQN